jgi:hypothetical protein
MLDEELKKIAVVKRNARETRRRKDKVEAVERYNLDPVDAQILKLMIQFPLISTEDIAATVNIPLEEARKRRAKKALRAKYAEITSSTEEHLRVAAKRAAYKLSQLVQHEDPDVALAAIKIALAPYINRAEVNVNMKSAVIFKSTVSPDGSLIQEVYEEQRALMESEGNATEKGRYGEVIEADTVGEDRNAQD